MGKNMSIGVEYMALHQYFLSQWLGFFLSPTPPIRLKLTLQMVGDY
jgi:hypothetical protein